MLKIYNERNLPKDKEVIHVPWFDYFVDEEVTKDFNESDTEIVKNIEGTALIDKNTLLSKFTGELISVGSLSEGCKTILCINNAIKHGTTDKYLFNITSCGENAIEYLIKKMSNKADIHVFRAWYDG